jgi:HK97 gp10 family phage protein
MAVRTELKGLKEVREGLAEFSKTVARNVGRRALMPAAEIIANAAQANAPVSTRTDQWKSEPGSLKASKQIKRDKPGKGMATVAIIFDDPAAVPTEYGLTSRRYPAQPWFRPAVDANESRAVAAFGSALTEEVEKAAAKAAKKSKAQGS